jgi:ankyrin repeat protein
MFARVGAARSSSVAPAPTAEDDAARVSPLKARGRPAFLSPPRRGEDFLASTPPARARRRSVVVSAEPAVRPTTAEAARGPLGLFGRSAVVTPEPMKRPNTVATTPPPVVLGKSPPAIVGPTIGQAKGAATPAPRHRNARVAPEGGAETVPSPPTGATLFSPSWRAPLSGSAAGTPPARRTAAKPGLLAGGLVGLSRVMSHVIEASTSFVAAATAVPSYDFSSSSSSEGSEEEEEGGEGQAAKQSPPPPRRSSAVVTTKQRGKASGAGRRPARPRRRSSSSEEVTPSRARGGDAATAEANEYAEARADAARRAVAERMAAIAEASLRSPLTASWSKAPSRGPGWAAQPGAALPPFASPDAPIEQVAVAALPLRTPTSIASRFLSRGSSTKGAGGEVLDALRAARVCRACVGAGPGAAAIISAACASGHVSCVRAVLGPVPMGDVGAFVPPSPSAAASPIDWRMMKSPLAGSGAGTGPEGQNVIGAFRYAPEIRLTKVAPSPGGGVASGGTSAAEGPLDPQRARTLLKTTDRMGRTALHVAAAYGHRDVVLALLEAGADPTAVDSDSRTPLHCAAEADSEGACLALLDADFDLLEAAGGAGGGTPLHSAAVHGASQAALALVQSAANPNARNALGRTPLHVAGTLVLVRLLVEAGSGVRATDAEGWMAVHAAAGARPSPNTQLLSGLLELEAEAAGAREAGTARAPLSLLNARTADGQGSTALHLAAGAGHTDAIAMLLLSGAPLDATDASGRTPGEVAAAAGQARSVAVLTAATSAAARKLIAVPIVVSPAAVVEPELQRSPALRARPSSPPVITALSAAHTPHAVTSSSPSLPVQMTALEVVQEELGRSRPGPAYADSHRHLPVSLSPADVSAAVDASAAAAESATVMPGLAALEALDEELDSFSSPARSRLAYAPSHRQLPISPFPHMPKADKVHGVQGTVLADVTVATEAVAAEAHLTAVPADGEEAKSEAEAEAPAGEAKPSAQSRHPPSELDALLTLLEGSPVKLSVTAREELVTLPGPAAPAPPPSNPLPSPATLSARVRDILDPSDAEEDGSLSSLLQAVEAEREARVHSLLAEVEKEAREGRARVGTPPDGTTPLSKLAPPALADWSDLRSVPSTPLPASDPPVRAPSRGPTRPTTVLAGTGRHLLSPSRGLPSSSGPLTGTLPSPLLTPSRPMTALSSSYMHGGDASRPLSPASRPLSPAPAHARNRSVARALVPAVEAVSRPIQSVLEEDVSGGMTLHAPRTHTAETERPATGGRVPSSVHVEEEEVPAPGRGMGRPRRRRMVQDYSAIVAAYNAQAPFRAAAAGTGSVMCVACHERCVTSALLPCEHAAVCERCLSDPTHPWDACPVCLAHVVAVVGVGAAADGTGRARIDAAMVARLAGASGSAVGALGPRFTALFGRSARLLTEWSAAKKAREIAAGGLVKLRVPAPPTSSDLRRSGFGADFGPESALARKDMDALLASEPGGAWYSDFEDEMESDAP